MFLMLLERNEQKQMAQSKKKKTNQINNKTNGNLF